MRLDMACRPVGCLVIGETMHMRALYEKLEECGVDMTAIGKSDHLLTEAQEALCTVRRAGGVCIVAEGEMWPVALALAAQLIVDRIALIAPTDRLKKTRDNFEKQIERLKGYARRNLFFCVSEVLILEESIDDRSARCVDGLCRGLCNSKVYRISSAEKRGINCEQSFVELTAGFLAGRDCGFSLAKNL